MSIRVCGSQVNAASAKAVRSGELDVALVTPLIGPRVLDDPVLFRYCVISLSETNNENTVVKYRPTAC